MDKKLACDIGAFIIDSFRQRRVFHTTSHPTGELFGMLLDHVLRSIGHAAVDRPAADLDRHFNVVQVPVHPAIARMFDVAWADERTAYVVSGHPMTWETYVRRYIEHFG
jgi:hypothetical protein